MILLSTCVFSSSLKAEPCCDPDSLMTNAVWDFIFIYLLFKFHVLLSVFVFPTGKFIIRFFLHFEIIVIVL